jgi:hypothetical protein
MNPLGKASSRQLMNKEALRGRRPYEELQRSECTFVTRKSRECCLAGEG